MGAEAWSSIRAVEQRRQKGIGTIKRRQDPRGRVQSCHQTLILAGPHPITVPQEPRLHLPHMAATSKPPSPTPLLTLWVLQTASLRRGRRRKVDGGGFEPGENVFPVMSVISVVQQSLGLQEGPRRYTLLL